MRRLSEGTPLFANKISGLKKTIEFDEHNTTVSIKQTWFDHNFVSPVTLSLEDYLNLRYQIGPSLFWRDYVNKNLFSEVRQAQSGKGIGFDIPIPIKSQAFQKIFGGNTVGLSVVGNVTIDGGLRHEKRSEVKTAINRHSNYNFKMKQTQRFTVKGNVGEKVNVYVDQDSERPFEFDNAIRLEYKGFEDEIIESIEAGNVSLSLPATRFVTFSAKNSGLFGIKSNMRLGNLKMTMIASQEKGQKKKLSISGGATSDENKIDDSDWRSGTYFFLNTDYRENFKIFKDGLHVASPNTISRIEVYKSEDRYYNQADAIFGWAVADTAGLGGSNPAKPDTSIVDKNHYRGYFKRLEQNTDYYVDKELGFIALTQPLRQKDEVLAVTYRDTLNKYTAGDIKYNEASSSAKPIILQLLRTDNPQPSDDVWPLEWKNVYYLGSRNINKEGFDLKIYFKPPSGDPQETIDKNDVPVSYLEVFGLDIVDLNGNPKPDNILDDNPNFINWARGELIFPELEPFKFARLKTDDPTFYHAQLKEKRVTAMYDTTNTQVISKDSKFYISVSAKVRETNYSLGFNVIEGSEEITLDGRRLVSGTDYIIDYFSGNLTILDERAADPNASLDITYESNQLFQIDRKTILGTRWDYELFNNSFIGGTLLYLNQSTLDQKIRIGQDGPMQNFVWNLNTALNFDPFFVTKVLNALPLVQTKEASSVKFEAEVAQIIPNPNSRNNEETGDKNGVVYIDDFEAAKRETPLGVMRRQWTPCSVPKGLASRDRGSLIWYNPYEQVPIKNIWPERDVNPNVPQRVHVLNMRLKRLSTTILDHWAGLMRYLSAGYADQSNTKFIEIWVRGDEGRFHIELGQLSEDAIANGVLDTEDKPGPGGIRNGVLDDGEDTGLDGVPGKDGQNVPGDVGNDDWSYSSGSANYEHINGTEGNLNDEGGRFPDTEDLNQNGSLDLRNDYFSYSFSLDKNHPDAELIAGGLGLSTEDDYGWRMYRIPLADPDEIVGNPQWTNIEYVRIWLDEANRDSSTWVQIAEINLVGSEWRERGTAFADLDTTTYDAKNDTTVRVTVINTYDNPDYTPPPGVAGEVDQITKIIRREQALVARVTDLPPGANGIVQKSFFQPQTYIDYKVMKMFVYGLDRFGFHIQDDTSLVELFFRFGADDRNYYEFRERVLLGWHPKNEMIINLETLTGIKNVGKVDKNGYLFGFTENGDTLRVVGKPSLTYVRQLTIGVINRHTTIPFTGEIWLNELRLTEVKKDKGMAMRARLDLKLADVMNINAEMNKIDDDFRTVNERFGKGNNQISANVNASFRLDKFLPQNFGLSIPINMGFQDSESSPKYFPGSDIIVSKETATDSLLETIKTKSKRQTISASIKKASRSRNPFIKYTIDGLSLSYSYAEALRSNSTIKEAKNFTYNGNFGYNINFDSKANFRPFGWLGDSPIVNKLSGLELYYLPKGLNYKFSFNRSKDNTVNRNGLETPRYTFIVNQSFTTGMQPLRSISFDFNYSRVNDLREVTSMSEVYENPLGLVNGDLGPLTSLRQSFKLGYNPNLFSWLKITLNATTNFDYSNNIQQKGLGKSASNSQNYSARFQLTPKTLFQKFTRKRPQTTQRPRTTIPRKKTNEEEEPEKKPEGKTEEKKSILPMINPLKLIALFGEKIQPVAFNYSQQVSSNNFGLVNIPSFDFQIGKTFNPGPIVQQNLGSNRGSFRRGYKMDYSTGMDITNDIKITFRYNYDNDWNRTTTVTGSVTETRWRLGEKNIFFPDWTLRWSGFEKLPFVNKFIQRASLDHGRSGRVDNKWLDHSENITSESVNANYRPLIGLSLTLKNGMNCNIQYNQSFSENINKKSGSSGTRKNTEDINVTMNYSKSGGFSLPFLKNKKIKNKIDFSMTFTKSVDVSEQKRGDLADYQEFTRNEKWSLRPSLDYSFSSTVTGGTHFEFGRTKNKLYGETRIIEFGINVNIRISGR